jgi:hypothetical protein
MLVCGRHSNRATGNQPTTGLFGIEQHPFPQLQTPTPESGSINIALAHKAPQKSMSNVAKMYFCCMYFCCMIILGQPKHRFPFNSTALLPLLPPFGQ